MEYILNVLNALIPFLQPPSNPTSHLISSCETKTLHHESETYHYCLIPALGNTILLSVFMNLLWVGPKSGVKACIFMNALNVKVHPCCGICQCFLPLLRYYSFLFHRVYKQHLFLLGQIVDCFHGLVIMTNDGMKMYVQTDLQDHGVN